MLNNDQTMNSYKVKKALRPEINCPFVSIIIPAKNEEDILPACIDSILSIDYPASRYEIILIDNGSTDNTVSIARGKGAAVFQCPSLTIGAMRNFGVKMSKGEIIAFIDADVIVAEDWLRSSIDCLNRHPNAACVGSFPLVPDEFSWVARSWWRLQLPAINGDETEVRWLASMNMVFRREAFEEAGGFNPNLTTAEDVDLCYRIAPKHDIIYSSVIRAYHYGEARSLIELFKKERWRGASNYHGIKYHGLILSEFPSLLLPLYIIVLFLSLILAIISFNGILLLLIAVLMLTPSAAKSILSAGSDLNASFLKMIICHLVYSMARTAAFIDWIIKRIFRF